MSRVDKGRRRYFGPAPAPAHVDPIAYAWERSNGRPLPPELRGDGRAAVSEMLERRDRPEKFW